MVEYSLSSYDNIFVKLRINFYILDLAFHTFRYLIKILTSVLFNKEGKRIKK